MIRPYQPSDQPRLIELLRLNIPAFFDVSEEKEFKDYLEQDAPNYFVVEAANEVIGSGGFNWLEAGKIARISWDIIHPSHQGKGIGKALTLFRIDQIKKNPAVRIIRVRTSQLVYPFYQKIGFELEKTTKDFWAKGFDLYQMKMEVSAGHQ